MARAKAARQPRKKHDDEEHRIQCACIRWFRQQYPDLKHCLFAVPNGGRRDSATGAKLKAEGVLAGVSDLILLKSNEEYGALLIEMKREDGRLSRAQIEWAADITYYGEYKYVICYSLEDFKKEIEDYLKNV